MTLAELRQVDDHGHVYTAILLTCPACGDLHMLPVSGNVPPGKPRWDFDGYLEAPTLSPSILTRMTGVNLPGGQYVCHSFLRAGVWEFLSDCTHDKAGQHVPCVPLPDWVLKEQS